MATKMPGPLVAITGLLVAAVALAAAPRPSPLLLRRLQQALMPLEAAEPFRSANSGVLGWRVSHMLTAYYCAWEATGDTAWLDRLVRDADVIFANRSPGAELYPGWRTPTYSVAIISASADPHNSSQAAIRPDPARIYDRAEGAKVTGHEYEVRAVSSRKIELSDSTAGKVIATTDLPAGGRVTQIPGVVVVIEGNPQPGDRFVVKTEALKPLEYIVHDGMFLTPMAEFCAAVRGSPALQQKYGEAAHRYLQIMADELPKWQPYWRGLPDGAGVYVAQNDPAQRFPGVSLPHNQYLALGRTFLALYRATGDVRYREQAAAMARFFKGKLRLVNSHYEWNYWDYAGPGDESGRRMEQVEDTSHGSIEIGFAVDAYDAGIVFDREDMERFARTVSDVMWNGNWLQPRVGKRVNAQGDQVEATNWVQLGRFSVQTRRIMLGMIGSVRKLRPKDAAAIAQVLALDHMGWSPQPLYATDSRAPAER